MSVLLLVFGDGGGKRYLLAFGDAVIVVLDSGDDLRRLIWRSLDGESSTSVGSGRLRVRVERWGVVSGVGGR